MIPKYCVRLDDIVPGIDYERTDQFIKKLLRIGFTPILGIVPFNQDTEIGGTIYDDEFWDRVRKWISLGCRAAMHGLHHIIRPLSPNFNPMISSATGSEFSNFDVDQQHDIIVRALKKFQLEAIDVEYFMAPAHGFNEDTLCALRRSPLGINLIVTDGFMLRPVVSNDIYFLPQQLWRFRKFPFGYWTICYHLQEYSDEFLVCEIQKLERLMRNNIVNLDKLSFKKLAFHDRIFSGVWVLLLKIRDVIREF